MSREKRGKGRLGLESAPTYCSVESLPWASWPVLELYHRQETEGFFVIPHPLQGDRRRAV